MDTLKILTSIVVVNLLLSGDNALVIALASRSLPERQKKLAILWGGVGAIGLRVILTFIAVFLLTIPYLQFAGGVMLLGIAGKLLTDDHSNQQRSVAPPSLRGAIRMIIFADLIMSLDNVIAIAAVARGSLLYLLIGLGLSIPIIMFGSQLVQRAMARWPIIVWVGAIFLGWTAGEMAGDDAGAQQSVQAVFPGFMVYLPALFAATVFIWGLIARQRHP
ncbi:YjbE family integral membrane protein [Sporomusaceae bacterium BoRhaA]|uniref:TerC family protein n=1 Tax=Pelorhabdus rhamnosifermentans TaxID=2772457 RepID=UPI001C05EE64|nr:TerC family protein [Pelorhabdus rhamnosifermentans]MBU2701453.1 YjbE family integral membrane protein [Pelorhabdus rhamnosifermentans]